ncbi:MAG: chromophore lyase CpcT/CpeT, partial [Flavobacteriales bacterium]|nr:chromophore lyase CpcT/CpeT [Flavobacteriales bacterium]
ARLWPERTDGVWLYVEQAVAAKKEKPYRQRVYHVQQLDNSTFSSTILKIEGGERFFGSYADPALLDSLHEELLTELEGCAITLQRRGDAYVGSTDGRACTNAWGEATYATSEVTLTPARMISWDRGYNDAGEQVWGAVYGGYVFDRVR